MTAPLARFAGLFVPYEKRLGLGLVHRPQYAYCMWHAGKLAQRLGHERISVLEFGVAGGNGLVAIEQHAAEIERRLSVKFEITGSTPAPVFPRPRTTGTFRIIGARASSRWT